MSEDTIRKVIETLDAEIAEAGDAKAQFIQDKPPICISATGNRAGLLRLSRTFLQAALEPIPTDESRSKPVLDRRVVQVHQGTKDCLLNGIYRMETWAETINLGRVQNYESSLGKFAGLLGCGIVACILLAIFIIGLVAIWKAF